MSVSSSKVCGCCLSEFEPKPGSTGKFCGRSCAAKVNNSKFPKRKRERSVSGKCVNCGIDVAGYNKYCSRLCQTVYTRKTKLESWLNGDISGSDNDGVLLDILRTWMLEKAGWKCTECGWGEINPAYDKPTLTVDHIDGNWQNNSVDNLKVLCYNCHTLTPTFGSLNKNNPLVSVTRRAKGRGSP